MISLVLIDALQRIPQPQRIDGSRIDGSLCPPLILFLCGGIGHLLFEESAVLCFEEREVDNRRDDEVDELDDSALPAVEQEACDDWRRRPRDLDCAERSHEARGDGTGWHRM